MDVKNSFNLLSKRFRVCTVMHSKKNHQVGLTKLAYMSLTTDVDQNDMCQPDCGTMFMNACTARYKKSETKNNLLGTLQLTQMFHGTGILTNIYHEFKPFM